VTGILNAAVHVLALTGGEVDTTALVAVELAVGTAEVAGTDALAADAPEADALTTKAETAATLGAGDERSICADGSCTYAAGAEALAMTDIVASVLLTGTELATTAVCVFRGAAAASTEADLVAMDTEFAVVQHYEYDRTDQTTEHIWSM